GSNGATSTPRWRSTSAQAPSEPSSGQLRAGLAIALAGPHPPQLLILDEPTNHLDLDAIETLEAAMRDFDGALVVVSHDPHFLTAIGITRTLELGQRPLPTALSK
ncbi:MAG TPA: AAA family ATPase, partial [Pedomonas sp.]|uniref:AAA family ATPase n=1 Tax=Pedomonas sp. TaxID=2976421 RepID=UPI002F424F6C